MERLVPIGVVAICVMSVACARPGSSQAPVADAVRETSSIAVVDVPAPPAPVAEPAPRPPVAPAAAVAARPLLCATGGTGVVPCGPESPDDCADRYYRAIAVAELVNPGPATVEGVAVSSLELLDSAGRVESRMRDEATLVRLEPAAAEGPLLLSGEPIPGTDVLRSYPSQEGWALLFAQGGAFDGTLPPGTTRLRVEVWLDHTPRVEPLRWRLGLALGDRTLVIQDQVAAGSWPTG